MTKVVKREEKTAVVVKIPQGIPGPAGPPASISWDGVGVFFRDFLDGQDGRPTFAEWNSNQESVDVTASLELAIGTGRPVYLPVGTLRYTKIKLLDCTQLLGAGMRLTKLKAAVSTEPHAVVIDLNYVRSVRIEDMQFSGNPANLGQNGWYFQGEYPPPELYQQGGIWYSTFTNVRIDGFSGASIWMRGGTDGYRLPNQFLNFKNVVVFRTNDTSSRSLLMTGQAGQVQFLNCEFDGVVKGVGTNVELSREFHNGALVGGSSIGGVAVSDICPIAVSFLTCTFQKSDYGVILDRAQNIVFDATCWFEDLYRAITTRTSSRGVIVRKSHFANAGSDGAGGGYLFKVGSASFGVFDDNDITGAYDTGLIGTSSNGLIDGSGNVWATPAIVARTDDVVPQLNLEIPSSGPNAGITTSGILNAGSHRFIIVNGEVDGCATELSTIKSNLGIGEVLFVRAVTNPITINGSDNIHVLYGTTKCTIQPGEVAGITRQDNATGILSEFQIITRPRHLSGPTSARPILANGEAGVMYWNTDTGVPEYSYGNGTWATGTTAFKARQGTATNDNAAAGAIGESIGSAVALGLAVGLSTNVAANVLSINLTAGDWDVQGNLNLAGAAATVTARVGGVSGASATLPVDGTEVYCGAQSTAVTSVDSITLPRKRISLAAPATIYLVAKATFSAGTVSAFGGLTARRVR